MLCSITATRVLMDFSGYLWQRRFMVLDEGFRLESIIIEFLRSRISLP